MQRSRDSHANVCNDEKCSHGKNVDATVWLSIPVVLIMSLTVCDQQTVEETARKDSAESLCHVAGLSLARLLFS